MNERIKQLAEQAGSTHKQNLGVYQFYTDELEMFVELIVLEICDVFDKRAKPNTGFYEPHEPAKLIKQHFGVEP